MLSAIFGGLYAGAVCLESIGSFQNRLPRRQRISDHTVRARLAWMILSRRNATVGFAVCHDKGLTLSHRQHLQGDMYQQLLVVQASTTNRTLDRTRLFEVSKSLSIRDHKDFSSCCHCSRADSSAECTSLSKLHQPVKARQAT